MKKRFVFKRYEIVTQTETSYRLLDADQYKRFKQTKFYKKKVIACKPVQILTYTLTMRTVINVKDINQ